MKWVDASYSKGTPSVWQLDRCGFRVTVHRYHGLDGWFLTAFDLRIEKHDLKTLSLEVAKSKAIEMIRTRLADMTASFAHATSKGAGAKKRAKSKAAG